MYFSFPYSTPHTMIIAKKQSIPPCFLFFSLLLLFVYTSSDCGASCGWDVMESESDTALRGIWGSSSDDIYAVGDAGVILHNNGTRWAVMESGVVQSLYGIWGSASDKVYAVGTAGTILHYDGTRWAEMESGTDKILFGIWGFSETDVYVVGESPNTEQNFIRAALHFGPARSVIVQNGSGSSD
ncbi:MAG: hypothetical protein D3904_09240, partial [Candidatus Electrothrix sp. EH2]|nr:hypothetical protein [Candidatus Electrothrix sp. EH2]